MVSRSVWSRVWIGGQFSLGPVGTEGTSQATRCVRTFTICCVLVVVISPDGPIDCLTVGFWR